MISLLVLSLAVFSGCGEDIVEDVKVSLKRSSLTIDKGQTEHLEAVVSPASTKVDLHWSSSDNSVAAVNSDGDVTGVAAGEAVITVSAGKSSATCKVTVRALAVQEVKLDKSSAEMIIGDKFALKATVLPADADAKVSWKSLNKSVASVDANGNVEALAAGKATIVAEAGGKIAQCMITVNEPVVRVESVKITKYTDQMTVGDEFTFEAVVTPDNATNKSIVWSSANKYVIAIGQDGKAEALGEGTVEISVKSVDGDKTDKCVVIVKPAEVPVQSVTITNKNNAGAITLTKGESMTLQASVAPANATEKAVEWSVSDPKVLSVDQNGKVTAVGGGSAKAVVKTKDGGKTDECQFVVVVPVESVAITSAPEGLKLTAGEQFQFTAVVNPEDATDKALTWVSSETSVLTVDASGKAVALKAGKAKVTVTSADGKKSDSREITVEAADVVIPVTGVAFNFDYVDVTIGGEADLSVTITPEDATDKSLIWSSSDETVITVNNGRVKGLKKGSAQVTVTTKDGGFTDVCTVNAVVSVTGVSLNKKSIELEEGQQSTLTPIITPEDAAHKGVTWKSRNPDVAQVEMGVVLAKSAGETYVIVNTIDGHFTDSCYVKVNARYVPVESVKITSYRTNLTVGESCQFAVEVTPANATDKSVTWSSSNKDVLTVDEHGNVAALAVGVADVIVTSVDGQKKDVCTVKVEPQAVPVESVRITQYPSSRQLSVGDSFTFAAEVLPADADDKTVTWSSSAPEVLTIDVSGKAKAVAQGEAVLTVKTNNGAKTDQITIKVVVPSVSVTSVELVNIPSANKMKVGDTFTFTCKVLPENASNKNVKWSSSDEKVIKIDADGKATALATGSSSITVTTVDGNKISKTLVNVVNPGSDIPVSSLTLSSETGGDELRHGKTLQLIPNYSPSGSYPGEIKWYSSNEKLATVDQNGLVKAVSFDYTQTHSYYQQNGYPTATITLNADGILAVFKVKILPAIPEKIIVSNPPPTTMTIGDTWDMGNITILPAEAEQSVNINYNYDVPSNGFIGGGSSKFTAKYAAPLSILIVANGMHAQTVHTGTEINYYVTVKPRYETAVELNKTSHTIEAGSSFSLSSKITPADATYKDVTWTSSNASVATVSNGVVTGHSAGTAEITVKTHHGKTAKCTVTVTARKSTVSIGDYYYSDGSTSASLVSGKTPVGVVFALVDAAASDPSTLGKDHSGATHGLVVGIESYNTPIAKSAYIDDKDYPLDRVASEALAAGMADMSNRYAFYGYSNTKAMKTWGTWLILDACATHTSKYALPSSTSGWYIPSLGEMELLGDAYTLVNEKLNAIGTSYAIRPGAEFWVSTFFGVAANSYTYTISGAALTADLAQGAATGAAMISSTSKYARFIMAF